MTLRRLRLAIPVTLISLLVAARPDRPASGSQQPPAGKGAERFVGLWGVTRPFGPAVRGELTILREADAWRASIAGMRAFVEKTDERVRFALPARAGEFRGRLEEGGAAIRGEWVQPPGTLTGVAWATPVELRRVADGVWRGAVAPFDETLTLYADVRVDADAGGAVRAVLRNPDGFFGNAKLTLVAEGDHFKLQSIDNGATLLEGEYDAKHDRLLLPIPDGLPVPELRTTLELDRLSRDQAVGYYPRTPAEARYVYRRPQRASAGTADGDGWATGSLADVGLDQARIEALVQKILDTDPRLQTAPLIQGLLIARHRRLVLEEYFYGFDAARPHDLRSAGKTLASVLAGIAIDRGAKISPSTPVYSMFPEYTSFANPDPRKKSMTVEHLMTMTSGFACDENDDDSPGNEGKMQSQTAQPDWYKFVLDLPLVAAPGEKTAYCSGSVNLIGGVVRNATRTWLPELFEKHLARPLQISRWHMNLTPTEDGYMGGGLHIRPRDMLKLGQLYLDGGVWNGRRVVSRSWVETSTKLHPMNAKGTDGYDWHIIDIRLGDRVFHEYEASGNGGQLLMVIPELDMVVMFTGGNYNNYRVWSRFRDELLPQYILAAATGGKS